MGAPALPDGRDCAGSLPSGDLEARQEQGARTAHGAGAEDDALAQVRAEAGASKGLVHLRRLHWPVVLRHADLRLREHDEEGGRHVLHRRQPYQDRDEVLHPYPRSGDEGARKVRIPVAEDKQPEGQRLPPCDTDGAAHQAEADLPHWESQQNLLLIEYQRIKYIKECNC